MVCHCTCTGGLSDLNESEATEVKRRRSGKSESGKSSAGHLHHHGISRHLGAIRPYPHTHQIWQTLAFLRRLLPVQEVEWIALKEVN